MICFTWFGSRYFNIRISLISKCTISPCKCYCESCRYSAWAKGLTKHGLILFSLIFAFGLISRLWPWSLLLFNSKKLKPWIHLKELLILRRRFYFDLLFLFFQGQIILNPSENPFLKIFSRMNLLFVILPFAPNPNF